MDQGYVLSQLRGRTGTSRPVREEPEPVLESGLSPFQVTVMCYDIMRRSLENSGTTLPSWETLNEDAQTAYTGAVEQGVKHASGLEGREFSDLAAIFHGTWRAGLATPHDTPEFGGNWEDLSPVMQAAWEAFARYFCFLCELDDLPVDWTALENEWTGWATRRIEKGEPHVAQ